MSSNFAGLSLRDLEYVVAVAELQHFGRAAARCAVSQAGLSEQVRKLEELLGLTLFERTTRRVIVTPDGDAVARQAREVLMAARAILELAGSRAGPLSGPLKLGVIATLGPYYVPDMLWAVRERFPKLELRLQEGRTHELVQAVQLGELDMALLSLPVAADGLTTAELFFEPFRAVFPATHPLALKQPLELQDLAGQGLLLLEEGHCLRNQALSLCGRSPGRGSRFASSLEMLRHMVAAGEGYSLLPLLAAPGPQDRNGLLVCRDLGQSVGRTIGLAWRATDPRRQAFGELASLLRGAAPAGTHPTLDIGVQSRKSATTVSPDPSLPFNPEGRRSSIEVTATKVETR
jgi:LysR family hydrogen peroxide-inducible transcriptional activator